MNAAQLRTVVSVHMYRDVNVLDEMPSEGLVHNLG